MAGAMVLDKSGNIYVTGQTDDANFPVTAGAFQTQLPVNNIYRLSPTYAFVTEFAADGKTIVFSTYFGSNAGFLVRSASGQCPALGDTSGAAVAVDAAGNVVIAGYTNAGADFPSLQERSSQAAGNCGEDATGIVNLAGFIAKFSPDGYEASKHNVLSKCA